MQDLLRPLGDKPKSSLQAQALMTELHYDFSREYSIAGLVGAFFKVGTNPNEFDLSAKGYYSVITDVKHLSSDVVQITRKHMPRRSLLSQVNLP